MGHGGNQEISLLQFALAIFRSRARDASVKIRDLLQSLFCFMSGFRCLEFGACHAKLIKKRLYRLIYPYDRTTVPGEAGSDHARLTSCERSKARSAFKNEIAFLNICFFFG